MNILICGPQGSGKTTQAELISQRHGFQLVDSGTILRHMGDTQIGKKVGEYMNAGKLVPSEVFNKLFQSYVHSNFDLDKSFVFTGFPRTLEQVTFLEKSLKIPISKVIDLIVGQDEFMRRIRSRALIEGRLDETDEAIKERLRQYHEKTEQVISYYREKNMVVDVNGEQDIESIYNDIKLKLGL